MTLGKVAATLFRAGWEVSYHSSEHLLVGSSDDHLKILARQDLTQSEDPTFQIIDGKRSWTYWVRVIISPHVAQVLLWEHGEPLAECQKEKHTVEGPSRELSSTITAAKKPA